MHHDRRAAGARRRDLLRAAGVAALWAGTSAHAGCASGAAGQRGQQTAAAESAVIPAPVGGGDEPYPIPWLDKNGSHNQAGVGLEPSSIYHFKGRIARAAEFVGSGVDGSGNRIPFGTKTTDNSFMSGECWTSQRRVRRGAWTHL